MIEAVAQVIYDAGPTTQAIKDRLSFLAIVAGSTKGAHGVPRDDAEMEGARGEGGGPDAERDDKGGKMPWTILAAKTISKFSINMQRTLVTDRLISRYVEWCDTPNPRAQGVAFSDVCIALGAGGGKATVINNRPDSNLYLAIPHPLRDPVLDESRDKVQKFLQQTFWSNTPALECQFAALAIALRGLNVDRAFWGIGSGGVGQSLFSALLAAILGPRHSYLDMSIYYSDEELRKQAERLVGCVVVTGQEAVEGSDRKMREHLYKKHCSANPVAARLPYGTPVCSPESITYSYHRVL